MPREIEFRAFDNQTNKMLFHKLGENHWYTSENKAVIFKFGDHHETALKTRLSTPMQYTGLKDSKGVKIFEGDYVTHEGVSDHIYEVIFERGSFYVVREPKNAEESWWANLNGKIAYLLWNYFDEKRFIVIGNFYECQNEAMSLEVKNEAKAE